MHREIGMMGRCWSSKTIVRRGRMQHYQPFHISKIMLEPKHSTLLLLQRRVRKEQWNACIFEQVLHV